VPSWYPLRPQFTTNVIPSYSFIPLLSRCYAHHPILVGTNSYPLQTPCHHDVSSAHSSYITSSHLIVTFHSCCGATHATQHSHVQIALLTKHCATLGISSAHSLQRTSSHLVVSFHSCYSAMHTILLAWGTNSYPLQTPCHHSISSTHSSHRTSSHIVATIHPCHDATHGTLPLRV
jgi:hypothetical protein